MKVFTQKINKLDKKFNKLKWNNKFNQITIFKVTINLLWKTKMIKAI